MGNYLQGLDYFGENNPKLPKLVKHSNCSVIQHYMNRQALLTDISWPIHNWHFLVMCRLKPLATGFFQLLQVLSNLRTCLIVYYGKELAFYVLLLVSSLKLYKFNYPAKPVSQHGHGSESANRKSIRYMYWHPLVVILLILGTLKHKWCVGICVVNNLLTSPSFKRYLR